ncbi:sigma-54-dependent Fis family transcriptional regulator [Lacrimispora sp.]|uniref:sigma-54-dependent Fis family transcriptional regulator n=1 Tax=Lacrimispora sp. TaxID=2719234 RepID=UPI002FDB95FA
MPNIILFSAGDSLAYYGELLKKKLSAPVHLEIINVFMEDAVKYARQCQPEEVDVIIARGNTAKLLKAAHLSIPVVTVPIKDSELVRSIEKAKEIYPEEPPQIAYIGMEDVIRSVSAFFKMLGCQIRFYPVTDSKDIEYSVKRAKRDKVRVIIGGVYTQQLAEEYGLKCVLLESSLSSLQEAYERALEVQKGVQIQKKKLQERITMLNSISDGLVSVNEKKLVTIYSPSAEKYFQIPSDMILGKSCARLLENPEKELLNQVLLTNSPVIDHIVMVHGAEYLLSINPVIVQNKNKGAILSFHPYQLAGTAAKRNARKYQSHDSAQLSYFFALTGDSLEFQLIRSLGFQYAKSDFPVLLVGEYGSGRETIARCIHMESLRKEEIFLSRNAAILSPEDLFAANGGTLYIRDIEQLSADMSAVIMDVLRSNTIQLPDKTKQNLNLRLMAGSAKDLSKKLPAEIYYLMNSFILPISSLRHRKQDIYPIFCHFMEQFNETPEHNFTIAPDVENVLTGLSWPGNISQLRSVCRRLAFLAGPQKVISAQILEAQLDDSSYYSHLSDQPAGIMNSQIQLSQASRGFAVGDRYVTYEELSSLNRLFHGKKKLIAESLGISRSTLWRHMKALEDDQ